MPDFIVNFKGTPLLTKNNYSTSVRKKEHPFLFLAKKEKERIWARNFRFMADQAFPVLHA